MIEKGHSTDSVHDRNYSNQKGVPLCMYMVSNTTQWSTVCIDNMQLQIPEEKKDKTKRPRKRWINNATVTDHRENTN